MIIDPSGKPITVLLIDDDEDDYLIIKHIFSRIPESPFELEWCSSYDSAKQRIDERAHDIYLIDFYLGEHNGLELLKYAKPQTRAEPFIMLTGMGDRETEKRSMQLAAADYLVKGKFSPELLSRTLHYSLGRKQIEKQQIDHLLQLNQAKDEFISLASHQLRTPATGVKQYLGMVIEGFAGEITSQQRTLLEKAYESNERQLRIVSDLLKVAQVDAGKVTLRKSKVDMVMLISDVIKEQQKTYHDRKQVVRFDPPNSFQSVSIDRDRIRMVIENILDNASKYSPHNTTMTVQLTDTTDEVTVSVSDQGVGIADEDIEKLFGKFSRIHNSLSTYAGGTGLGLYWANEIVTLHGGSIDVDSTEGKGTTFFIHLPKT